MRKLGTKSLAKVIPLDRAGRKREVRMELGVDEVRGCIFLRMSGEDPCVALTADRAEEMATDLMQYVHELRNGGKLM